MLQTPNRGIVPSVPTETALTDDRLFLERGFPTLPFQSLFVVKGGVFPSRTASLLSRRQVGGRVARGKRMRLSNLRLVPRSSGTMNQVDEFPGSPGLGHSPDGTRHCFARGYPPQLEGCSPRSSGDAVRRDQRGIKKPRRLPYMLALAPWTRTVTSNWLTYADTSASVSAAPTNTSTKALAEPSGVARRSTT